VKTLGRGKERTIKDTSVEDIFVRILDKYVEQEQKKAMLTGKRISRAKALEDAILLLLAQKGVLEKVLKELGVSDEEVQRTIVHLKAEYDVSPKSS
jgi:hypothetical protein